MNSYEPSGSSLPADFGSFVATRVADDANLEESLQRVAVAGCELLDNGLASSVTIITGGRAITMASTDDIALTLDQAQYDAGDGPCLTAARRRLTICLLALRALLATERGRASHSVRQWTAIRTKRDELRRQRRFPRPRQTRPELQHRPAWRPRPQRNRQLL